MSFEQTFMQEMSHLTHGEYSHQFYYPSVRNSLKETYKDVLDHKNQSRSIRRASKNQEPFVPFLNERDHMGRLIKPSRDVSQLILPNDNLANLDTPTPIETSPVVAHYINSGYKGRQNSLSILDTKDLKLSTASQRNTSFNNSNIGQSSLSKQLSILPSLVNEATSLNNTSSVDYLSTKLKYNEPVQDFGRINANRQLSRLLASSPKNSACFIAPSREDKLENPSIYKGLTSPSVGQYEPDDSLLHHRVKNVSFGSLPKFHNLNKKLAHEYNLEHQQSFDKVYKRAILVPSFAKQVDRVSEFSTLTKKNEESSQIFQNKQFQKCALVDKYKTTKGESLIKDTLDLEKKRHLTHYLNEKNDPLDARDVDEYVRNLKTKYNLKPVFKIR